MKNLNSIIWVSFYLSINPQIAYTQISQTFTSNQMIEIPFTMLDNLITVEAEINGQKGSFIFDTGANDLRLNTIHFKGLKKYDNDSKLRAGITGEVSDLKYCKIKQFKWQNLELQDLEVMAFDMSHLEKLKRFSILGIIGYQIIKDFEVVIDYQKYRLFLYSLDKEGNTITHSESVNLPSLNINFKMAGHIPIIPLKIGKYQLYFGLDTGAEFNILHNRCRSKVLKHFTKKSHLNLWGVSDNKIQVEYGILDTIKVAEWGLIKMKTLLTNMDEMNKSYNALLDGILGFDFLCRQKTAINYCKKILYIWQDNPDLIIKLPQLASKTK